MAYTTQMDAAAKGILTEQMRAVAEKEGMDPDLLLARVAAGRIAVPANKNHKSLVPEGIGEGMRTKINVNLGVSKDCCNLDAELDKVKEAINLKAEAIMDLSSYGKTGEFRRRLVEMSTASIGTVPVYDAVGFYDKDLADITADEFIRVFEQHAKDGVDFMTVHAGINRNTAATFARSGRKLNIVSRGGSLLYAWMQLKGEENPFYERFDELLDICAEYDVTLSLGDACRPGCIADSTDASQIHELITLGELTKRAWARHVQVMIEGPGHMRLNEIAANVQLEKRLCHGAPFYVLGPLVTDIAPGYDHITSAIGGAVAGAAGADFLCYVTPAEHLRLPTYDDMREGIFAAKIAAHAADLAKGTDDGKWDDAMADARRALDWEKMFELAIDPEKARRYRKESFPEDSSTCTMCGKMCSVRNMNSVMDGKDVNII
ncbi:phosphomethylpyrimidine synthase ThiC [Ethanoligenens harbinense]|uniref:Phosphomethylpyrimidine synthase n=1 Tax=Ethanoligenens harbinense (strain DSM 18485 / JCM 12961 / CGMCC 1.5033 / YUAN-3) TaxID=663278 RepID=E6U788_ETHHY|nr:phosphomethylpyrimidine synthase ThiC [Ethanoligenens harbinense]ADU25823.1 thiamine biosynthesis protein ThiC [Ethanoligenens harbinense YUAN-3]AVQ94985.1 phosphomethylpyrimidine synthase ThiC [Ethanoligenens harbinense YUAN-3]AYF37677.1 phosphomethylpyrimidine synthase ThiC [Ethanoligenens harbinense]AYF40397.1 phosphomethylpyrimidine synthase ThiC [Ethanoligenens harbinense]QCN91232.1 phosphomethylpyrimidine synthase ThiC [Ethanoligenens harbinense]